jgi:cysteinyl-tRNA synthetase
MSHRYLGENFDVHGGGADLQFPHHENEIAQSCSAYQGSDYASFWIHNGFLTVNGEKMSKSLKNFITVNDLLTKGINGTTIRLMLLSTHYRKPLDFNQKILDDSNKILQKFHEILQISDIENNDLSKYKISPIILEYLADDLNISKVLAFLHEQQKTIKNNKDSQLLQEYIANLNFLGFLDKSFIDKNLINFESHNIPSIDQNFIEQQLEIRQQLKAQRKFKEADAIRDNLLQMGVGIEDLSNNQSKFYLIKKD